MITTEIIDNPDLIEDACALLYDSYIEQGKWVFSKDNPSEIRIEIKNGRKLLVDKFVETARWFGVFDNGRLIGCARLCGMDRNNKYEVEGYPASQPIHEFLPRVNCMEMGKVAVSKDYKGKRIINLIYLAAFEYCQRNKFSVFTCIGNVYIKSLFQRIKLPPKIDQTFKYEETDPTSVSLYLIDYQKGDFDHIIENIRANINFAHTHNYSAVIDALEIVAPLLPLPVYWHDRQGHVLGINELCLQGMGTTLDKVLGKSPYDFYPEEIAKHILDHHELVMQTEQILSQEEFINNLSTGQPVYAKALKVPLYDDNGNVTGIIGTSIDITAEKEAESLRLEKLQLENQAHRNALEHQEKITLFARKVAHDINSPLAALKIMMDECTELPEIKLIPLNQILNRLTEISRNLLDINDSKPLNVNREQVRPTVVYAQLAELLTEKRVRFLSEKVVFKLQADVLAKSALTQIQAGQFNRAFSNLINNAVDALADTPWGEISIEVKAENDEVVVTLQDNGKGMSSGQIAKIMSREGFTEGKKNGHGLGLQQVWDMLDFNSGKLHIDSVIGRGTTIRIAFPEFSENGK